MTLPRAFLAAATAFSLAGCVHTDVVFVETPPAIGVEPASHVLLLRTGPGGGLGGAEHARLHDFLNAAGRGRLDAIHVTVISANPRARHTVMSAARRIGVEPFKIKGLDEFADEERRFGVRVIAVQHVAYAPDCPDLKVTGPSTNENDFEPTVGCSDLSNLAANVNDPRDLLVNPAVRRTDGERAALPVARYRSGAGAAGATPAAGGVGGDAGPGTTPTVSTSTGGGTATGR